MHSRAVFILDPNEFRAAGYATLLTPWASRSEIDLHLALCLDDIRKPSAYDSAVCIFCVGGRSLRNREVADTLASLQETFGSHPLIVLSDLSDSQEVDTAIEAGIHGFLPTTMASHVGVAAIQFILAGGTYLPHSHEVTRQQAPAATRAVVIPYVGGRNSLRTVEHSEAAEDAGRVESVRRNAPEASAEVPAAGALKRRHVEVLAGIRQGFTNKAIARQLNLTEATVKLYVRQLMKLFKAENRTQLALRAAGYREVDEPARPDMIARAEHRVTERAG